MEKRVISQQIVDQKIIQTQIQIHLTVFLNKTDVVDRFVTIAKFPGTIFTSVSKCVKY